MMLLQYLVCWLAVDWGSALSRAAASPSAIGGATNEQRAASVAAYAEAKVGDASLAGFLFVRCGFVISGVRGVTFDPATGAFSAQSLEPTGGHGKGMAAAVDPRGYFITNSHVVAASPLYVLFRGETRMHMEEAQVVWRADLAKNEPDLAILYVPATLLRAFEWAPSPQASDKILGVGPKDPLGYQFTLFGGETLKSEKRQRGSLPAWHEIKHSAPFRPGDSGGPLVNASGQLLAINAIGIYDLRFFRSWNPFQVTREFTGGTSYRPDIAWVKARIDADAKQRAGAKRGS